MNRTVRTSAVCFAGLSLLTGLSPTVRSEEPPAQRGLKNLRVSVVADTTVVKQYDVLLVKTLIENTGDGRIEILCPHPSIRTTSISVETSPFSDEFELVSEFGDPIVCVFGVHKMLTVGPGQKYVVYDRIFCHSNGEFVFQRPGKYKLYSSVAYSESSSVRSKSLAITVLPRKKELLQVIERELPLLAEAVKPLKAELKSAQVTGRDGENATDQQLVTLDKIRRELNPSNLSDILEWKIELLRHKHKGDDLRKPSFVRLARMLEGPEALPDASREVLALSLARRALELGDRTSAYNLAARIPVESTERRMVIEEATRRKEGGRLGRQSEEDL